MSQLILSNAEELILDSSDSESSDAELLLTEKESKSESGITRSTNLDTNEEDVYDSNSPENPNKEQLRINVGPVLSLQCLHDDNVNEHSQIMPVKIVAVKGSSDVICSEVSHPHQSSIPANNDWEGVHNFRIKIPCSDPSKKNENTIFCESQKKLYVAKNYPFKVLVYAENVPKDSVIKVVAVFARVEHSYENVKRCPTHSQADYLSGNPAFEHFVQCNSEAAVYTKDPNTGKLSLSVPYEKPQEGELYTTYLFKLACFSSCSGGINRRPFVLVFTLEKDNIPLGRQTIETKVCACPLRDFKVDQGREHRKKPRTEPTIKYSSDEETVNCKYTISVKDPELYMFLKQMKCFYEMSAYSKTKPDT